MLRTLLTALVAGACATTASAGPDRAAMTEITESLGEMTASLPEPGRDRDRIDNALRFEPIQNFDEMFLRDDVVFLMRHGPTDWSKLDAKDVAPGRCAEQRVLSEQGRRDMRDMGALLADNGIAFARIVVSEWCRNRQTVAELGAGYETRSPGTWSDIPVSTDAELNLLLSLQGARTVSGLRELVSSWDGGARPGPLLIVTHFTNIQELTEFSVYEGEILVLDPGRENRVLGYLRLRSAAPDVGHFDQAGPDGSGGESGGGGAEGRSGATN